MTENKTDNESPKTEESASKQPEKIDQEERKKIIDTIAEDVVDSKHFRRASSEDFEKNMRLLEAKKSLDSFDKVTKKIKESSMYTNLSRDLHKRYGGIDSLKDLDAFEEDLGSYVESAQSQYNSENKTPNRSVKEHKNLVKNTKELLETPINELVGFEKYKGSDHIYLTEEGEALREECKPLYSTLFNTELTSGFEKQYKQETLDRYEEKLEKELKGLIGVPKPKFIYK